MPETLPISIVRFLTEIQRKCGFGMWDGPRLKPLFFPG
jgi:hypothetical protein